jgi:hydroxymethylglutaryl-CoA reductase
MPSCARVCRALLRICTPVVQGVALNMTVNGKDYVVPMVLEEPSVVAAVGNVARMTRPEGFTATSDDPVMVRSPRCLDFAPLTLLRQTRCSRSWCLCWVT